MLAVSYDAMQLNQRGRVTQWMTWRALLTWPYLASARALAIARHASLIRHPRVELAGGSLRTKHSIEVGA
jgi:hypothetical protein